MSVLKKLGAVALGTASATGWVTTNALKIGLVCAAEKIGKGSITGSDGVTHTAQEARDMANKCNDSIFTKGFKKSVELWKEDY